MSIQFHEVTTFEKVLNHTNLIQSRRFFSQFFESFGVDINEDKYIKNGESIVKRFAQFMIISEESQLLPVLNSVLGLAQNLSSELKDSAMKIINRINNKSETFMENSSKNEFLNRKFDIDLHSLNLSQNLQKIISQRIFEIEFCLGGANLAVIFLCGSILEGLLLDCANKNEQKFIAANSAPKDKKTNKVKKINDWTLGNLIDVSYEIGLLSVDTKKFSSSLREFRNYIHPKKQEIDNFTPDNHTAKICWQVLQAAIADLLKMRYSNND